MKHMKATISSLKCDNPNCDYVQPIQMENMGAWVGALCPDCDHVLLTQEDYDMAQQILDFCIMVDDMAQDLEEELGPYELGPRAKLKISMDQGEVNVGEIEWETH